MRRPLLYINKFYIQNRIPKQKVLSDGTTGVGSNALHGDRDPAQASKENARKLGTPEQEMANANNDEGEGNWKREHVVFFDLLV